MEPLTLTADQINAWVGTLLWPLFRFAGLFALMPVLGEAEVPVRVRMGLALLLAILVAPTIESVPVVDPLSIDSMLITAQQILIGLAMGLALQLLFSAVLLAGESIAITMGLGFAVMNDPQNGVQVPSISQFYLIMATLIFLSLDGHHAVLALMVESFRIIPIGQDFGTDALWALLTLATTLFEGGLAIALPGLAAMLSVNLVMGVMTRSAPQLNIFSVGFPMTMTVGFIAIMMTLPAFGTAFERLLAELQWSIGDMLAR